MVRAVFMTDEQVNELVALARADEKLWAEFKDRERSGPLDESGMHKLPSMAMIAEEIAKTKYGDQHTFELGSLIIGLRYAARRELGLPVE
jgi:hypothetical protein